LDSKTLQEMRELEKLLRHDLELAFQVADIVTTCILELLKAERAERKQRGDSFPRS
jgi:hypothetical protein